MDPSESGHGRAAKKALSQGNNKAHTPPKAPYITSTHPNTIRKSFKIVLNTAEGALQYSTTLSEFIEDLLGAGAERARMACYSLVECWHTPPT